MTSYIRLSISSLVSSTKMSLALEKDYVCLVHYSKGTLRRVVGIQQALNKHLLDD